MDDVVRKLYLNKIGHDTQDITLLITCEHRLEQLACVIQMVFNLRELS